MDRQGACFSASRRTHSQQVLQNLPGKRLFTKNTGLRKPISSILYPSFTLLSDLVPVIDQWFCFFHAGSLTLGVQYPFPLLLRSQESTSKPGYANLPPIPNSVVLTAEKSLVVIRTRVYPYSTVSSPLPYPICPCQPVPPPHP
jgi:hypothetical protein